MCGPTGTQILEAGHRQQFADEVGLKEGNVTLLCSRDVDTEMPQRAAVCLVPLGRGRLSHAREVRASRSVGNWRSALERGRARGGLDGRLVVPIRNGAVAVRHPVAAAVRRTVVRWLPSRCLAALVVPSTLAVGRHWETVQRSSPHQHRGAANMHINEIKNAEYLPLRLLAAFPLRMRYAWTLSSSLPDDWVSVADSALELAGGVRLSLVKRTDRFALA